MKRVNDICVCLCRRNKKQYGINTIQKKTAKHEECKRTKHKKIFYARRVKRRLCSYVSAHFFIFFDSNL